MIQENESLYFESLSQVIQQMGDAPMLSELEQDILGELLSGSAGQIGSRQASGQLSLYNRIPSDTSGPCTPYLLAYCRKQDDFDKRLADIVKHIGHCPGTERVYFITTKWRPQVWGKHEASFRVMPARLSVLLFAMGRFVLLSSA